MRNAKRGILILVSAVAAAWAIERAAWQTKSYTDWTEKDAQQVMINSPWAKEMPMPGNGRPDMLVMEPGPNGATQPSASLGNPSNSTAGTNMTVAANPGSNGPAETNGHNLPTTQRPSLTSGTTGAPEQQPVVRVIWASATPVRLAVLKLRSNGNPPSEAEIQNAAKERPNYTVAVVGMPPPEPGADVRALASGAFLSVRGKAPVAATESNYRKIGNSDVYFFRFPRTSLPLSAQDQQVEFRVKMGRVEIKRKFDLRD